MKTWLKLINYKIKLITVKKLQFLLFEFNNIDLDTVL